jgi:hypothetical protein
VADELQKKETREINEINAAVREVIKRAVVDSDFRQLALRDSKAALAKVSSVKLPAGLEFKFVDNFNKSIKTISLPDPIENAEGLTEEELEEVAGGFCLVTGCITTGKKQ